jgi:peptide/nickel transport system permease protein
MSAAAAAHPGPREEGFQRISYGSIVWGQLQRNRLAVFGMRCVGVLVALAVYAPLLSLDVPLVWRDASGWQLPFLPTLFNRLVFENGVDVFFNLALVASPLYGAAWWLLRRRMPRVRLALRIGLVQLALFAVLLVPRLGPLENPLHASRPLGHWQEHLAAAQASGEPVFALFPLRRFHYRTTDPARAVLPPSAEHWLGTDEVGRDVFARMLYGTRISLTIGVVAVAIYVSIGVVLGSLAGYFGGWVDDVVSRLIEVMICFPPFILILSLAALVERRSIFMIMAIIGITSWTGVARLVRAEFLRHRRLEYATAAEALGIPRRRIIFAHILPNAIAPVLVSATFGVASAILVESGLAFLGLGDVSVPSWGETLNAGRLEWKMWLILAPGVAIFFVVSVLNLVGEGLRDALDPKLRK